MAILGPMVGVGAVIWRGPDQLLLVRRGKPPRLGEWSIPGGRVEAGETMREALMREVTEETGLSIEIAALVDVVDLIDRDREGALTCHYALIDFSAHWRSGQAHPGSDVAACGWFRPAEALDRVGWAETRRIIRASARQMWQLEL